MFCMYSIAKNGGQRTPNHGAQFIVYLVNKWLLIDDEHVRPPRRWIAVRLMGNFGSMHITIVFD